MARILDTNILSELRRSKPEPKVLAFIARRPLNEFYISAVTLAELRFGIEQLGEGSRRAELNYWLTNKIRPMFDRRVLAVTEDIMLRWRILVEDGRKTGHTFSQPDLIIAVQRFTTVHNCHSEQQRFREGNGAYTQSLAFNVTSLCSPRNIN